MKVAVVGFGHLGKWHADKAKLLMVENFTHIVEKNETNAKAALEKFPHIKILDDVAKLKGVVDAAIVVTPTAFHFEVVKQLLEMNIHTFCEKPVTETYAQAIQLKELKLKYGKKLQVGHSERFHAAWDILKSNDQYKSFLTDSATVFINRYAPFKGRATDVDVVSDLMIHDIDLMLHLFKELPVSVNSTGHKIRTSKFDYVSSIFKFKNERVVTITVGRNAVKEVREVEIISHDGVLNVDLFRNTISLAHKNNDTTFVETSVYEKRDHLYLEQQNFYKSIAENTHEIITIDDGINALLVMEKVWQSLAEKREVLL